MPEPTVDRFQKLMSELDRLLHDADDLNYAHGNYIISQLHRRAEWVWKWLEHEAECEVLEEHIARTEGQLDLYRLRDEIEENDWSPEAELEEPDETP